MTRVQETVHRLHIEWSGEQETLASIDVFGGQLYTLSVVLDAFGNSFEPERFAEFDHGVNKGHRLGSL